MEKKVKVRMPLTRELRDDVFVAVNGKTYLLKRGEDVELPAHVAKVLERRETMLGIAMEFERKAARPLEKLEG